jgi:ribose transport system permease protein
MGEFNEASTNNGNSFVNFLKMVWREYSVVVIFIIAFIFCAVITQGKFATPNNVTAILRNISTIGIISLGMTFVLITGGIDLSSGPVLATAGTVLILLQGSGAVPLVVAILACVGTAVGFGFVNGIIITKAKLPPFIVTLAIGIIARSITTFVTQGATIVGKNVPEFTNIGNGDFLMLPVPFWIWIISAVVLAVLLTKTKFGTYVFAVGGNEVAAKYSGIKVDRIKIWTYMLIGLCVAIGAVIDMSRMAAVSSTSSGNLYEFEAITAAVVGGTAITGGKGKIVGTVIGALFLGVVSNMMIMMSISPYLNGAVKGAVILMAVLFQRRDR